MNNDTNDWMKDLSNGQKNSPLKKLILPGSHDSGAYTLKFKTSPFKWVQDQKLWYFLNKLALLPGFNKIIKGITGYRIRVLNGRALIQTKAPVVKESAAVVILKSGGQPTTPAP